MKTKLFSLIVLGALILGGCAKKTDTTSGGGTTYDDSFTLSGSGLTNSTYNISSVAQQSCAYDANSNTTTVTLSGISGDSVSIAQYTIVFTGKSTGTYTLNSTGPNVISFTVQSLSNPSKQQIYSSSSGKLTISTYGASGSKITGTYSGTFQNFANGNNYTLSGGTFSANVQ